MSGQVTRTENNFYFQMDRLSLNDMVITDSITGTTVSIPKLEWTGFMAGKGKFDLGNIHVDIEFPAGLGLTRLAVGTT